MDNLLQFRGNLERIYSESELVSALKDYLDIALLKNIESNTKSLRADRVFNQNKDFWTSSIDNNLVTGQVIKLQSFKILEWLPSSPGLYFTPHAEQQRRAALDSYQRWNRKDETGFSRFFTPQKKLEVVELRPNEKMGMVQGGYGCLRVAPKNIRNEIQHILCASSNGIGHEGLAITLKQEQYEQIVEEIKNGKVPVVNITGRLMILPRELSPIKLQFHEDIPKFYLEVAELEVLKYAPTDNALVSVAITYARKDDYLKSSSFSYSFCSFSPTKKNKDLKEAVVWLQDYAQRYSEDKNPIIVGDFDEEFNHFENVEFPIRDIANGRLPVDKLLHFKELFHLQINELFMGDKNVFNQSQIGAVGSHATSTGNTFQQINYSIPENLDYQELNKELTLLKQELAKSANSPEEYKALSDVASAEKASSENDGNKVIKHLKEAGKWVFDTATKIGVNIVTELIKRQM